MDPKDERLSESDTDDDFSAENVELVSHGHSHSEIWSITLEGAVNLKETQIVNSGLNWLSELKKGRFPLSITLLKWPIKLSLSKVATERWVLR